MKEEDIRAVESELGSLPAQVEVVFHDHPGHPLAPKLGRFAESLCRAPASRIVFTEGGDDSAPFALPALTLVSGPRRNLHYLAVPEGHQVAPFLRALRFVAEGRTPLSNETRASLDRIASPTEMIVLVSSFCTHCPRVVETVAAMASECPLLSVSILDVQDFDGVAASHGIKSVPAVIVDRELVFVGETGAERLSRLLEQKGTEPYECEIYRSLLERGRVHDAAGRFILGRAREALVSMFEDGDLSTRMGVLVVFETVLDEGKEAMREVLPSLVELLAHQDSRIRGDIADLLGKIGDPAAIPYLEPLRGDPDPDVVEAASDALSALSR